MALLAMSARAAIAAILLVAGGAKLADLGSFSATVRMFSSYRLPRPLVRAIAVAVPAAELGVGAASLAFPAVGVLGLGVFALCCGFVAVSAAGYLRYRGRPCLCFGPLSGRRFNAAGIARAAVLAVLAGFARARVRPGLTDVGVTARVLLLAAAAVLAVAAFSAARAVVATRELRPRAAAT